MDIKYKKVVIFLKILVFITSLACLFFASTSVKTNPGSVNKLWFSSILLLISALFIPVEINSQNKPKFFVDRYTLFLYVILALSFFLRYINLLNFPPDIHGDEAEIGLGARAIINGVYPNLAGVGWYDVPLLSFALPIPFFRLFGDNLFSLRLTSVFLGILSIILTYQLASIVLNKKSALVSAALVALSALHIHYSRSGTHFMQGVALVMLTFWSFWRGTKRNDWRFLVISGIFAGFSLQVYFSGRIAPVVIGIFLFLNLRKRNLLRQNIIFISAFCCGTIFSTLPLINFLREHETAFNSRTEQVLIFNALRHMKTVYPTASTPEIILIQFTNTIDFLFGKYEIISEYGYFGRGFDIITTLFCILGLAIIIRNFRRDGFFLFLMIWLTVIIAAVTLTIDAPTSRRSLPIVPAVAIVASVGILHFFRWLNKNRFTKRLTAVVLVLLIALIAVLNIDKYFVENFNKQRSSPSTNLALLVSKISKERPNDRFCLLSSNDSIIFDYPTTTFLSPESKGVTIINRDVPTQFCKIFIATASRFEDLRKIKENVPEYSSEEIRAFPEKEALFEVLAPYSISTNF